MATLRQYVNLDPGLPDELKEIKPLRAGRKLRLVARISPVSEGVPVVFEMKVGGKNVSPSLDEANFSKKEQQHLKKKIGSMPGFARRRSTTDKQGKARATFTLSEFGGDEFEVSAYIGGKKGKKKLLADKFVVWRRFYYQVSSFKSGPKGAGRGGGALAAISTFPMGTVKKEFEDRLHNIEMIDESKTPSITRRCNVLVDDKDYKKSAREGYDDKREPLSMRMVLVNMIAVNKDGYLANLITVKEGLPVEVQLRKRLWFDESLPEKEDWLIEAEWRWDEKSSWKDLDKAYLKAKNEHTIVINFQDIPKKHFLHFFRKAQIRLKLRYLSSSTNGVSWYNAVWIANTAMHRADYSDALKQMVTVHEAGHFIDMVPPTQSTHYVGHGHQGPHCSQGLSALEKALQKYWGLHGTCVMFGECGESSVKYNKFCADCDESVRTRKVRLDRMPQGW